MEQYHDALKYILDHGEDRSDRTGVGTRSVFGYQMRFNLSEGFPAVTTKKLAWKSVVSELLWFLEGSTDERRLAEIHYGKPREELIDKTTIWTANADNQGKALGNVNIPTFKGLGPVYGKQWRNAGHYGGHDQIAKVLKSLKENPDSRRHIVSTWDVANIDRMSLPPCHTLFQFYVSNGKLSCQLYQRSADMFLGVPFNIASYALLLHIFSKILSLEVAYFVHTIGDAHIYSTHMDVVKEQIQREPRQLPTLRMPDIQDLNIDTVKSLSVSDFVLENYEPMDSLKAPMAI